MRRLAIAILMTVLSSGTAGWTHVIDPCNVDGGCNYWEDHTSGDCLRGQKVEISDGTNSYGYVQTLVQALSKVNEGGYEVNCGAAWNLIQGKLKYDQVVWKHVYNQRQDDWVDSVCYDSGWVTNTTTRSDLQETHDYSSYGNAPCGSGYYFVGLNASMWVDFINNGNGAWTNATWTVTTDYHYFA